MEKKFKQTCAKRQGFCIFTELTLKECINLGELVPAAATTRSALIRELVQADIAVRKNNGKTAQPPPKRAGLLPHPMQLAKPAF